MKVKAIPQTDAAAPTGRVLVVDDHARARESMSDVLRQAGRVVRACGSASEALAVLQSQTQDVVVTDLQMPGMSGLELVREIERRRLGVQVIMVTAHATVASAVEAMRHGAFDYIEKPFGPDQLERLVAQAIDRGRLLVPGASADAASPLGEPTMIGTSPAMQELRQKILQIAPTSETVLVVGESGTGKELVARSIHAASQRAASPLVSLNCPALSSQLMESELFGHERGAFTGADAPRTGRFELADGGTILLDEVTEIDLPLQAKLLRVLQERAFERVGSSQTRKVDVRVLATTNRDIFAEIKAGRMREDLYFRLAVVPLRAPPLRERSGDVAQLVEFFVSRAALRLERPPVRLETCALELLTSYHWPGNVRELENLVTRACVLNQGDPVTAAELRPWLIDAESAGRFSQAEGGHWNLPPVGLSLQEMEQKLIEATLQRYDGHRAKTATALGIGLRTLTGKLKAYGYAPRAKAPS